MAGLLASCMGMEDVDPSSLSMPEVKTFNVKDNGSLVFELSANVDKSAASRIAECGFCYGKDKSMSDAERIECRMTGNTFSADLTLREYGETYYICSYISNGSGSNEILSDPKKVQLKELEDYVELGAPEVVSYDKTTAEVEVKYEAAAGVNISEYGLCYGTDLQSDVFKVKATAEGRVSLKNLVAGNAYQMRSYVRDGDHEICGKPVSLAVYGTPVVLTVVEPKTDSESAVLSGKVEDDCGKAVTERGFIWCEGAVESLDVDKDAKLKSGSGSGEFTETLSGLSPNRIYSFCAYAENAEGLACGDVVRFTTGVALPVHGQPYITGLTSSSAVLNANVLSDGGEIAKKRGFYWGPDAQTEHYVECVSSEFNYELNGLSRNTTYYFKSYSANSIGSAESEVISFTTMAELPAVITGDVNDIEEYSASVSGSIEDDGGAEIADKGFVYGTYSGPDMKTGYVMSAGSGSDPFSLSLSELSPNRTYYIRAYAVNSAGVSYGEEHVFTTKVALPSIGTISLEGRTSSMLKLSALILDDGGETPSEAGFYYSLSEGCDTGSAYRIAGKMTGNGFSAEISGLSRVTEYHVRAYAVNSAGEYVGDVVSFVTSPELPVVETVEVESISDKGAVCRGRITDNGGDGIISKGVIWSTSENLTINLSTKTDEGEGGGDFISTITNLNYSTKYYVRAYATNSAGTSYGQVLEFSTEGPPNLSKDGSANCYIISESGIYTFDAVKGNSAESVGEVKSVEVLWESFGTSVAPKSGDLIKSVSYSNDSIIIQTAATFREGNAVVAAKDASGIILWSWHIWLTDQPKGQVYYNNAGTMMDRNLGATSTDPTMVESRGLFYQWGRKDPFMGMCLADEMVSTITWPSEVSSSYSSGTIKYTVENPTTYITGNSDNSDWYYSGDSSTDNNRWQSNKTIYDPCPTGWRVPDGGSNGVWAKACGKTSFTIDEDLILLLGVQYAGIFGSASNIWYPGGCRDGSNKKGGYAGFCWSVTRCDDKFAEAFTIIGISVRPTGGWTRSSGGQVRCLKE